MRNIGGEYGVKNEREEFNEIIMYRLPLQVPFKGQLFKKGSIIRNWTRTNNGDRVKYPSGQGENFKKCISGRHCVLRDYTSIKISFV